MTANNSNTSNNPSHLTAICRHKLSAPMTFLLTKNLIHGRILDFGCGKGEDYRHLKTMGFNVSKFDPYWAPKIPDGLFDVITCHYVLNVLYPEERNSVLESISQLLTEEGTAYISVRRDIKEPTISKTGTFQDYVILDYPSIFRNKKFEIYKLTKTLWEQKK